MEAKGISWDLETEGMRNKQRITIYTIFYFMVYLQYAYHYPQTLIVY